MNKCMVSLLLAGFLFSPTAWAQPVAGNPEGKKARKGPRARGPGARGARDLAANLPWLAKRLKLDQAQQDQVKPLVDEYNQARQAVMDKTPGDVRERRAELFKEMREAAKAKDKEKRAALGKELAELRKKDPAAQELDKLRQDLFAKIEPILREDQKAILQKLTKGRMARKPTLEDPAHLRRCLSEVQLRKEQRGELKKIDKEFNEARKALGKDASPEKRKEMGKQYHDEIMKVLDAEQKQQLEQIAQRGPTQGFHLIRSPKLLEKALEDVGLRPDQQTSIAAMKERYQADVKAAGKDARARMDLNRKLYEDVIKLLDDAQKEKLLKFRGKRGPRGKGKKKGDAEG